MPSNAVGSKNWTPTYIRIHQGGLFKALQEDSMTSWNFTSKSSAEETETTRAPMAWESEASDAVPEVYEVLIKDVNQCNEKHWKNRFFALFMIFHDCSCASITLTVQDSTVTSGPPTQRDVLKEEKMPAEGLTANPDQNTFQTFSALFSDCRDFCSGFPRSKKQMMKSQRIALRPFQVRTSKTHVCFLLLGFTCDSVWIAKQDM